MVKEKEVVKSGFIFEPTVRIPFLIGVSIIQTINRIHEEVGSKIEVSILGKGNWSEDGETFILSENVEDYFIPPQENTSASVNFLYEKMTPEMRDKFNSANVCIHSHPNGVRSFSTSDYDTISVNYECSLLVEGDAFRDATVQVELKNGRRIYLDATPVVDEDEIELISGVENVEKKEFITSKVSPGFTPGYTTIYNNGNKSKEKSKKEDEVEIEVFDKHMWY